MKQNKVSRYRPTKIYFDKEAKVFQWRKDVISTNGVRKTGLAYGKKRNIDTVIAPFIKIK